jgi:hypothetical protein
MAERISVVIEAKDAASGVLRGITSQFGALGNVVEELTTGSISWGNVAQQATNMVITTMKEALQATVQYAGEVRKLSQITGESAEETSRLLQVTDDYKISADQLTDATRTLARQGLSPTNETLAELSDQYKALNSGQERATFLTQNFGRAGSDFAEIMSQGGDAIRAKNDAVAEGLILDQRALTQAREYESALEDLSDAKQEMYVTLGQKLIPNLTIFLEDMAQGPQLSRNLRMEIAELEHAHSKLAVVWEADHFALARLNNDGLDPATRGYIALAQAIERTNGVTEQSITDYSSLIGVVSQVQSENENYAESVQEIHDKQADLLAQIKVLNDKGYDESADEVIALRGELVDLDGQLADTAKAHEDASKRIVFSMLQARLSVDGLKEGEYDLLIQAGESMGILDESSAQQAQMWNDLATALETGAIPATADLKALIDGLQDKTITLTVNAAGDVGFLQQAGFTGTSSHSPRAAGGTASAGGAYMVGEVGPEAFTPMVSGTITPANQIQTYYVYGPSTFVVASGGSVPGSDILSIR